MKAGRPAHAAAVGGGSLLAAALLADASASGWREQLAVAVPLVLLLGLPHGAADMLRAGRPGRGAGGSLAFVAGYLALAAAVVAGWIAWPGLALAAFLAVSILHFAATDREAEAADPSPLGWAAALARGSAPVVGLAWIHPGEVTGLFALLIPGTEAAEAALRMRRAVAAPLPLVAAVLVVDALAELGRARARAAPRRAFRALTGPALLLTALPPPLVGFAIYFCGWHAPVHTAAVLRRLRAAGVGRPVGRLLRAVAVPWATTVVLGATAWLALPAGAAAENALRVVFVGLAALTLPHALLAARDARGSGAPALSQPG